MRLSRISLMAVVACGLVVAGCDEESDPPIIDTTVTPTAVAVEEDLEEEEEIEEEDGEGGAGGQAKQPKRPYRRIDPFKISKCCAAIAENKASAPPGQEGLYDVALGTCNAAKSNPALLYQVSRVLPNAPAVCK